MFSLPDPRDFLLYLLALLIGLTVHEFAHAIVALWLGDDTAKRLGRVTLNPLAHLDPAGTIFLIISSLAKMGIGWAKPVPVDPRNLRVGPNVGMAIVAVAGPVSNLILALIGVLLIDPAQSWSRDLFLWVRTFVIINVSLAVFNMLPIPPLDGFSVVLGFLPDRQAFQLRAYAQYGGLLLLALVFFAPGFLGSILSPAVNAILVGLITIAGVATGSLRF